MKKRIHIIPVGGDEPVHTAHETCKCQPLPDEDGLMIHHAQDLREARERHGRSRSDEKWVLVEEVLANHTIRCRDGERVQLRLFENLHGRGLTPSATLAARKIAAVLTHYRPTP